MHKDNHFSKQSNRKRSKKLRYGQALEIAAALGTSKNYVCNVMYRYRKGCTIYGPLAKSVVEMASR